ncbi:endothelin-converting enzyme 1-like [Dermacentor albipictus]|uniref:endothelin-converting enzyme 1-like n=1 Tax=Dermacentor albipictus TaxID=60249 RepID=UPI0031FBCFF8
MSEQDHTATNKKRARDNVRRASTASKQPSKSSRKKSVASARDSEAAQDEQSREPTAANVEMTPKKMSKNKRRKSSVAPADSRRGQSSDTIGASKRKSSAIKQKQPALSADVPSQPSFSIPIAKTEDSGSAVPTWDTEKSALPAASHVPLVPALEEQSSAAGLAKQQATADKPKTVSSQVLLAKFARHADKQATSKPPEDVKAESEVSGVAADGSGSTPAAPIPSVASGCASKEDARPASAAAARVSSAAGVEVTVLSPPPTKDVLGAGVTSPQDTVLASGTQAVPSPAVPHFKRAMSLREKLKASSNLSPISLHLTSFDVAAMAKTPKEFLSGTVQFFTKRHAIISIVVVATVFLAVTAFLLTRASNRPRHKEKLCVTDDCLLHASLLMRAAEPNIDACDDFRAHVCSNWSPQTQRKHLKEFDGSTMEDMVYSWFAGLSATLEQGSQVFPVGKKPLAMLESCLSNSSMYGSRIQQLQTFMTQYLELYWPKPPHENVDALRVLITLAYFFQAPLWFVVRPTMARRRTEEGRWTIVLKPAPLINRYFRQHNVVKGSGPTAYMKYWMEFYHAFSNDSTAASEERAIQAEQLEGKILKVLSDAVKALPKHPAVLPIGQLETYTPTVSSSRWLAHLQSTVYDMQSTVDVSLSSRDAALITDRAFFVTVGELFKNYTNKQILEFLEWQFVQHYTPVVDSRFLISMYGDNSTAINLRTAFCSYHVEVPYKALIPSLHFASQITNSVQQMIDHGYKRLVSTAVRLVNESAWLDSESRVVAAEKLASANLRLWPPAAFLDKENLAKIFRAFPDALPSFGEYWLASTLNLINLNRTPEYEEMLDMPLNYALPYFDYDYVENSVGVAVGAVNIPLYYRRGTKAMFYGGFGFSVAFQLAKALDEEGIRWHPKGLPVKSILSASSQEAFDDRYSCVARTTAENETLFPEIPALEIAYTAFLDEVGDPESTTHISKNLSELKVFFMTICHMTCTRSGITEPFSADCNKLVRHSSAFAKAFRCPVGSKMNPKNRCTFFY